MNPLARLPGPFRVALLLAAILLCWWPALHAPFTYDDRIEVVGNRTLRTISELGAIAAYNTSRPLLILTYAFDWRLNGLDPFGYHVTSLVIHAANALLAWRLARRIVPFPALVAALWTLHPMTTEGATYITGRSDALEATSWLIAITAWIDHRAGRPYQRWIAWGAVATALLTKETGILLPAVLVAVDRFLTAGRLRDHLLPWILGFGAVAARVWTYGWPRPEVPRPLLDHASSQAEAWLRYAQLWVLPVGQSILHDAATTARWQGAVAVLVVLSAFAWSTRTTPGSPAGKRAFALVLAACWLLPSSLIPLLEPMAEHRAYLAGLGLVLAVATLPRPTFAWVLVPILALATVQRNRTWADEVALWGDAAAKNPASARAWYGYGEALRFARRFKEAAPAYRRAAELDPHDPDAAINLGIVRAELGDTDGAREAWTALLREDPKSCPAHNNLAALAFRAGELQEAEAGYAATLNWCPDDPIAHLNLGNLATRRGDVRAAAFHYQSYLKVAEDGPAADEVRERLRRLE